MHILLSNDDGILAPGLAAIRQQLTTLGDVSVVAPSSPQSAAAHGITLPGPISARRIHVQDTFFGHSVEGRPADCVKLAVTMLLESPPDLVVSGINDGANVSINVLYSGTVAAAAEGALLGFPAVAISLQQGVERNFDRAAAIVMPILQNLLKLGLGPGHLININIPDLTQGDPRGVRVVPQAIRTMKDEFSCHRAPDGRDYYWLAGGDYLDADDTGSDLDAIMERYIAITPLHFDLTHYGRLNELQRLMEASN